MKSKRVMLTLLCLFVFGFLLVGQSLSAINAANIMGVWLLDEGSGTVARDSSGRGNNGTLTTNPAWVAGRYDRALQFDGTNGVDIANPDSFNFLTWTYTLRFKVTAGGDYPNLLGRQFASAHGWTIHMDPGGTTFRIRIDTAGGVNQVKTINKAVRDDQWHFGAITQDDSTKQINMYCDDVKGTATYAGAYTTSGGFLRIASPCVGAINLKGGSIDEVAIFNAVLSEVDINSIRDTGMRPIVATAVSLSGKLANTWGQIKESK